MNARPDLSIDITVGLDHLRRLDARGMHQLAALHPEGNEKRFITFCLDPTGEARATSFLREFGPRCNVYYSANEVRLDLGDKRAKKADIQTVRMVIADLDPAKNVVLTPEVLARERERLETVRERVACEDECFYSFAVDSGGGLQLGWLLDEKLPASRFADLAEDQTRGILRHLGAEESTTDITRLCRLPGTLNFPTEAKRRQGRNEVTPARVIEYIGNSNTTLEELAHWAAPVEASRKARATGNLGSWPRGCRRPSIGTSVGPESFSRGRGRVHGCSRSCFSGPACRLGCLLRCQRAPETRILRRSLRRKAVRFGPSLTTRRGKNYLSPHDGCRGCDGAQRDCRV